MDAPAHWIKGRGFTSSAPSTNSTVVVTARVPAQRIGEVLSRLNSGVTSLTSFNLQHLLRARKAANSVRVLEVILAPARVWNQPEVQLATRAALGGGYEEELARVTVPGRGPKSQEEYDAGVLLWPMRSRQSEFECRKAPVCIESADDGTQVSEDQEFTGMACEASSSSRSDSSPTSCPFALNPDDESLDETTPPASQVATITELVILFYKYVELSQTEASTLTLWIQRQALMYHMLGRVLVATEGVNGTLAGPPAGVRAFMREMKVWRPEYDRSSSREHAIGSSNLTMENVNAGLKISASEPPAPFADLDFKQSTHRGSNAESLLSGQSAKGSSTPQALFVQRCPKPTKSGEAGRGADPENVADGSILTRGRAFSSLCVRLVPELITSWQCRGGVGSNGGSRNAGAVGGTGICGGSTAPAKQYDDHGAAARHLPPEQFHRWAAEAAAQAAAKAAGPAGGNSGNGGAAEGADQGELETVILDVRNSKEFSLGHFAGAQDIGMRSFCEFPALMAPNLERLRGRRVLMYCTGGIRCEKASAWLRAQGEGFEEVYQLRGGIHKYLEAYGSLSGSPGEPDAAEGAAAAAAGAAAPSPPTTCLFQGKNFVFDARVALSPAEHDGGRGAADDAAGEASGCAASGTAGAGAAGAGAAGGETAKAQRCLGQSGLCGAGFEERLAGTDGASPPAAPRAAAAAEVGRCAYCRAPWDVYTGDATCAVCRDPVLACAACRPALRGEFHCMFHGDLRHCYFGSLARWADPANPANARALKAQAEALEGYERGLRGDKAQRNRRRTLRRQRLRVLELLATF